MSSQYVDRLELVRARGLRKSPVKKLVGAKPVSQTPSQPRCGTGPESSITTGMMLSSTL
jgi:hypothetical protein